MRRMLGVSVALFLASVHVDALAEPPLPASPGPAAAAGSLTYQAFLAQVARGNLELLAQRASVSIADAQIAVARIFPEPVLTAGIASVDVSGKGAPTATTVGLGYTVELGGKRSAKISAATADLAVARTDLDDFLRTLRGSATLAFIDGLHARLVLERKQQTRLSLEKLVAINQERLVRGDIGKVQLTQSRVEALRFRGEVLSAEAEVQAADLELSVQLGSSAGSRVSPQGDLKLKPRSFNEAALLAQARGSRPDLVSRQHAVEAAVARVDLAKANRWVDLTLNVGWQHSFASSSAAFAAPSFDALGATVSVPLPLSRVYRGELDAARATEAQGRTLIQATELKIEVELRKALTRYRAAVDKLGLYTGGLLADADGVLEAMLYNYQRGGATLLEVLEAQRTVNEVYLAYYDALAEHARALVAVELGAGIWDVEI
jgi:cobalt-zinc-cadmium efflux system outer membrane protein